MSFEMYQKPPTKGQYDGLRVGDGAINLAFHSYRRIRMEMGGEPDSVKSHRVNIYFDKDTKEVVISPNKEGQFSFNSNIAINLAKHLPTGRYFYEGKQKATKGKPGGWMFRMP